MVHEIIAKTILNKHKKRDEWFLDDYSLNPYKSCDFNCTYCYVRGSKYGRSVEGLAAKINAPELLEKELMRRVKKKEYGFIALSSATEPWMNIERKYGLTRRCLEIISKLRFPVHCLTKSPLILRDLDLLEEIDRRAILPQDLKLHKGVLITFSFSTLDEKIARIFEPNAPSPKERLETLHKIKEGELYAGIAYLPVLPFISDSKEDLEEMMKTAKEFQADYVFVGPLTLYGSGKELYYNILRKHFPELLPKYKQLFKASYQPSIAYRVILERMARELCEKYEVRYKII